MEPIYKSMKKKRTKQLPVKKATADIKMFLRKDKEEIPTMTVFLLQASSQSCQY